MGAPLTARPATGGRVFTPPSRPLPSRRRLENSTLRLNLTSIIPPPSHADRQQSIVQYSVVVGNNPFRRLPNGRGA